MPYALKEKQREFQRKWANTKNAKKRLSIVGEDGVSIRLTGNTVTYEQLTRVNDQAQQLKTWGECVKRCREFVVGRQVNRMAIAAITVRACVIKRGGDMRSEFNVTKDLPTLTRFAKSIHVNKKTLGDWVAVKRMVLDNLSSKETDAFDYTCARRAIDNSRDDGEKVIKNYYRYLNEPGAMQANYVTKYLGNAAKNLTEKGIKNMSKEDIAKCVEWLKRLNAIFGI